MSELKNIHPYLYKRIRLKGIIFALLGLSSIFAGKIDHLVHATRNTGATGMSPIITGGIFLVISAGILTTLYGSPLGYKKSRKWLLVGFIYAIFWSIILFLLAITRNVSTISILILWGYLTYNLWIIYSDTAWGAVELVRKVQEANRGK